MSENMKEGRQHAYQQTHVHKFRHTDIDTNIRMIHTYIYSPQRPKNKNENRKEGA